MEEYAGSVQTMDEEEIVAAVKATVNRMKEENIEPQFREILQRVFAPEMLGGKLVEKGEVARIVKQVITGL